MSILKGIEIGEKKFLDFAKENNYFLPDFYFSQLKVTKEFEEKIVRTYLDGSYKFVLNENDITGFLKIEKLSWDSRVFNKSMGKMTIMLTSIGIKTAKMLKNEILKEIDRGEFSHLSCQVASKNIPTIHFLEELDFKCMDNIIRFGVNLNDWNSKIDYRLTPNRAVIRKFVENDQNEVIELSKKVFNNYSSRFQNDPSFSKEESDMLYSEWIKNSIKGFADLIIVAELDNNIVGFSTVKYKEHVLGKKLVLAEGQLAGVLPSKRGKGINKNMLLKRLELVSQQADFYEVGTQIYNYASQKTFYRCGLEPIASYYSYHKTFKNEYKYSL